MSHPSYTGPGTMAEQLAHLRGISNPENNVHVPSNEPVLDKADNVDDVEMSVESTEKLESAEEIQSPESTQETTTVEAASAPSTGIYEISVPYEKCFVCRHLLVGMPSELPAGADGKMRKVRSALFKCYEEPTCPARFVRVQYNPFSREIVAAALQEWVSGDIASLAALYKKADGTSDYVRGAFHQMVQDMMRQI